MLVDAKIRASDKDLPVILNNYRNLQDLSVRYIYAQLLVEIWNKFNNQDHVGKDLSNGKSLEVYLLISQKNDKKRKEQKILRTVSVRWYSFCCPREPYYCNNLSTYLGTDLVLKFQLMTFGFSKFPLFGIPFILLIFNR